MAKFVDAFIISWPGKHEDARNIHNRLKGAVDRLTVLYANKDDAVEDRPQSWIQFPDSWYFGDQFRAMIDRFDGDILLHVMADSSCEDWPGLVAALRDAHAKVPQTGVWSPDVDYSSHPFFQITVGAVANSTLHLVTRTDETVWALSRDVVDHMRTFDYGLTPLGWGIDLAAAMYCHVNDKPVVLDTGVHVFHPHTTGYDGGDAHIQMLRFLRQLTLRETVHRLFLTRPFRLNAPLRRLVFWATRSRRYRKILAGYGAAQGARQPPPAP